MSFPAYSSYAAPQNFNSYAPPTSNSYANSNQNQNLNANGTAPNPYNTNYTQPLTQPQSQPQPQQQNSYSPAPAATNQNNYSSPPSYSTNPVAMNNSTQPSNAFGNNNSMSSGSSQYSSSPPHNYSAPAPVQSSPSTFGSYAAAPQSQYSSPPNSTGSAGSYAATANTNSSFSSPANSQANSSFPSYSAPQSSSSPSYPPANASNPATSQFPPSSAAAYYSSAAQQFPPSGPSTSYENSNPSYRPNLPQLNTNPGSYNPSIPSPRPRPPPVELPPNPDLQPPLDSVFNQVTPVNPFPHDGRAVSRPPPATANSFTPRGQPVNYRDPYASEGNTPDAGTPMESPMHNNRGIYNNNNNNMQPGPQKKVDRIDPKQIPRPAEVRGNVIRYHTRSGQIPPPALSDYQVVDEGNCSPRFVRLTTNQFAHDNETIDQTKLCIGAIIQPLAPLGDGEEPIPIIEFPTGPLRCSRCMAYINPFFEFIDQGKQFNCNICGMKNEVPEDYRCNLDPNGLRRDRADRPELCRGSVEFAVGAEFLTKPIQEPCYLFVLDVSYPAIVNGLLSTAIAGIRSALDALSSNPRIRVGLITYDTSVQFYSLQVGKVEPSLFVMSDIDDVFVPCPMEQVCVRVSEPEMRISFDNLLNLLPVIHGKKTPEAAPTSCFGAAVAVAAEALAETGGKVLMIQSSIAGVGIGKLENRDNPAMYNTPQERSLQSPFTPYYTTIATKCAENSITVDLYICSSGYVDLATIGALAEKTGGQLFLYPRFSHMKDGHAFERDVFHNLTRQTGYDGVMVVRCSTGLKVAEHFGNFYHRRINEMDLPSIDCDKTFGIRIEHEAKLKDKTEACIQTALLYTNSDGQRRIRVHTISVPITSVMSNIYRYADLDSIINLSLKQAVRQILDSTTLEDAQKALTTACVDSLYVYRKFCASATSAGQLILPEPLKLLPLNSLGLIKHILFQDNIAADERAFIYSFINSMPSYVSVAFVCPRLFSCLDMPSEACFADERGRVFLPTPVSLSSESLFPDGIYLLDDGRYLYLLVGPEVSHEWIEQIFLAELVSNADPARPQYQYTKIRSSDNPTEMCNRIQLMIDTLRKQKANFQNLLIVFRRPPNASGTAQSNDEAAFNAHLIEDSVTLRKGNHPGVNNAMLKPTHTMSYVDFLCWLHRQIQNKFY